MIRLLFYDVSELGTSKKLLEGDFPEVPRAGEAIEIKGECLTVQSVLWGVEDDGSMAVVVRVR